MSAFQFKEFSVLQDRCAMKIGTDGVLLGAWASIQHQPFSILDIGSGTGVIALMLAQRSSAEIIDALDIDDDAYEQCVHNFENSPWSDRLFCYHASLEEFAEEIDDTYDLIVSNPPFYSEDFKTQDPKRDAARFTDAMPFEQLLKSVSMLLSETGVFSIVLPFKEEAGFIHLASHFNLYPQRILHVKGTQESKIKRSFLEFSFLEKNIEASELIIETKRHQYTQDYVNLTKDFYIKM